ncbi:MAG: hypothetical protein N0C90_06115, partial [Candidatus Thiodiazotropha endolucinida]|nr:hypothetical protein [Candidatus Thiodiazotropha taylori]MCW4260924.1 hypothetical protein [Candidatus Thiodiazotropha endolucinida]
TGRTGKHASLTRYIPVHGIHNLLTIPQRQLLHPVYCLTGCDTTSSFFGHGKKSAFRILKQKADSYVDLAKLKIVMISNAGHDLRTDKVTVCSVHEIRRLFIWQE